MRVLLKKIYLVVLFGFFSIKAFGEDKSDKLYPILLNEMSGMLRAGNTETVTEPKVLTLDDCLRMAFDKSGRLQIAKEEYKLAIINFKHARRDLFPNFDLKYEKIDGTTTGEDFRGNGAKLEMQYPLYVSGRTKKLYKQSKLNLEIAKLKHDQILLELFNETEKAYYVWTEAKLREKASEELLKISDEALSVEKKRFDQKLSRDIDWMESKIFYDEVRQKFKEAKNDLKLAEFSLRQLLDLYTGDLSIQDVEAYSELKLNADELIPLALEKRPDIKLNRFLEKVNKYNKEIAKAESRLKISLDGYTGRRAENFVSEKLKYENEYYIGVTGSLPLGVNTIEAQVINQDTVPSAGQTTSTQFTSESVKFNIFDNKFDSTKLEGLIKYYKALEDSEKIKKAAIFEIGKYFNETIKAFEQLDISKAKKELASKKLEFQKLGLAKNESTVNEYLKEAISYFDAEALFYKAISGYYSAVADLNKSLGAPGYFNPKDGSTGTNYIEKYFEKTGVEKSFIKSIFSNSLEDSPYYPTKKYEDIKFKTETDKNNILFWRKENKYSDPIEENESKTIKKSPWKFWGN